MVVKALGARRSSNRTRLALFLSLSALSGCDGTHRSLRGGGTAPFRYPEEGDHDPHFTAPFPYPEDADHDPHFDFYIMTMKFQPEFCYEHRAQNFDGCHHPLDEWKGALTIHGLWPERTDGSWPEFCTTEEFNPKIIDQIGREEFEEHWPNVEYPPNSPEYDEFWEHEWSKHGTCSGMSQLEYFTSALEAYVATPAMIKQAYDEDAKGGGKVDREALIKAYGGPTKVALVCDARRYLAEVRVCVGKNRDGTTTGRITCNDAVLNEDSCYDKEIYISKFPSSRA